MPGFPAPTTTPPVCPISACLAAWFGRRRAAAPLRLDQDYVPRSITSRNIHNGSPATSLHRNLLGHAAQLLLRGVRNLRLERLPRRAVHLNEVSSLLKSTGTSTDRGAGSSGEWNQRCPCVRSEGEHVCSGRAFACDLVEIVCD